ncbi:MAG: hypothetical protein ACRCWJ_14965 [Casimicrobium sp.]
MTATKPTPLPHCDLRIEWETLRARGEIDANYWRYETRRSPDGDWIQHGESQFPDWEPFLEYRIVKGPNHPDNQKPKLRLIDKSKLPRGTMTGFGEILCIHKESAVLLKQDDSPWQMRTQEIPLSRIKITPQERWTAWTGGDCPVPEGLLVELVSRDSTHQVNSKNVRRKWWGHYLAGSKCSGIDIIAYRILGLAEGWTDDESLSS